MIQFQKGVKNAEIQHLYTREDLINATNASIDFVIDLIRDLPDSYVTFQPLDPDARDDAAANAADVNIAWTLGHVVVHITASSEESAALGSLMARGVENTDFRVRWETPWESVSTIRELLDRLEESRRIRLAYLNAWPDQPHLDVIHDKASYAGPVNAVGRTLGGLRHDANHYGQLQEIIRQATEALSEAVG